MSLPDSVRRAAAEWLADDPDPDTVAELESLLAAGDDAEVADAFAGLLQFGTAGLRGRIGPGPNRMNVAVVRRAAAGLAAYLGGGRVVIGYDARHKSDLFARETARVMAGAGLTALLLPEPLPTPVLAFAIRLLDCDAGVMVTASHNPPADNGYKVYLGDGSQIVPPADARIAARIAEVAGVSDLPLSEDYDVLGPQLLADYVTTAAAVAEPDGPRGVSLVFTSLHGVGGETLRAALTTAGFPDPVPVAEQYEPDPDFPTVSFPNPEEPGAMDLALAAGSEEGADGVLANDPDADRCALAIRTRGGRSFRMLSGDELGALLGWWIAERDRRADRRTDGSFANSIVSSRLLGKIAAAAGIDHHETLTGFKWIVKAPFLRFGYEEAIGYCVAPWAVRDKDGISTAVLAAELLAVLKAEGRTPQDVLDDLACQHGLHATRQWAVRVADLSIIAGAMARLREQPPSKLAGSRVIEAVDLAAGSPGLPPTDGLRYLTEADARVIVRPSGTEPKLKCYLEVIEPVTAGVPAAEERADAALAALQADIAAAAGLA